MTGFTISLKTVIKEINWNLLCVCLCVNPVIQVSPSKTTVCWPDSGGRSEVKGHLRLPVWVPRHWCRLRNALRPLPAYTCERLLHILNAVDFFLFVLRFKNNLNEQPSVNTLKTALSIRIKVYIQKPDSFSAHPKYYSIFIILNFSHFILRFEFWEFCNVKMKIGESFLPNCPWNNNTVDSVG